MVREPLKIRVYKHSIMVNTCSAKFHSVEVFSVPSARYKAILKYGL